VRWAVAALGVLALGTGACQRSSTGATLGEYQAKRAEVMQRAQRRLAQGQAPAPTPVSEAEPGFGPAVPGVHYDPTGKRDPFRSFILDRLSSLEDQVKGPLEQFDLSQLSVVGIVWDANRRRALVEDPSGRGYVVKEGTAIGKNDGRVMQIDDNLLLVRETYVDYVGEKTTKDIPMRVRPTGQGG
jgi:type IV pilus assembly protein PilP